MLKYNLQMFNDEITGGGVTAEPVKYTINGQEMTAEQVVESYKKLQAHSTKTTQENSDLKKAAERVQQWVGFDDYLTDLEQKTGLNVKAQVGQKLEEIVQNLANGKTPTNAQMNNLSKQIDKAEEAGNTEMAKRLEELEATAFEAQREKAYMDFEKSAKAEGIEFSADDFDQFAYEYLSEHFDLGEDDGFTIKQLKAAYQAFEAKQLKEARKKDIPALGTSGGSSGPDKKEAKTGGISAVTQRIMKRL